MMINVLWSYVQAQNKSELSYYSGWQSLTDLHRDMTTSCYIPYRRTLYKFRNSGIFRAEIIRILNIRTVDKYDYENFSKSLHVA